jgi:hypothetical protein
MRNTCANATIRYEIGNFNPHGLADYPPPTYQWVAPDERAPRSRRGVGKPRPPDNRREHRRREGRPWADYRDREAGPANPHRCHSACFPPTLTRSMPRPTLHALGAVGGIPRRIRSNPSPFYDPYLLMRAHHDSLLPNPMLLPRPLSCCH